MELQSIKKIVEAEKRAEMIKKEANDKAEGMINEAKQSKSKFEQFFRSKIEKELKEFEEEEKNKNKDIINNIQENTSKILIELKEMYEKNSDEAVNTIFKKVVEN